MSESMGIVVAVAVGGMLLLAGLSLGATRWRKRRLAALEAGSCLALTSRGPIEYARIGRGPVILYVHGTNGYDQGLTFHSFLCGPDGEAHFTVLSPSRPGYLRTPLATGRTPQEQADALAALLNYLAIDRVVVLGASAGGPPALQFALRHPHRTQALVMFSAVTRQLPRRGQGRMGSRPLFPRARLLLLDLVSAGLNLMLRFRTRALARRLLRRMTARSVTTAEIRAQVAGMMKCPRQVRIFRGILASMLPISPRLTGMLNDQEQIDLLPDYPLEQIRTPTLIFHGRADCLAGFDHAEFVASKVSGAELYEVEGGGHFLWVGEQSLRIQMALLEFLCKHGR